MSVSAELGSDSTPLVSVLLASRNGARYVGEALESVAAQSYRPIEIVAVDDGSDDGTGDILRRFAARQAGMRVLRTAGVGVAAALNLAAREAGGPLFARHDDDDRSHPERIERQVRHLAAHPEIGVVGSAATRIDADGRAIGSYAVPLGSTAIAASLHRGTPFVGGAVLLRREVYEAAGGYRAAFRVAEDVDLWLRIAPLAGLANLPQELYCWREHPGGSFARARGLQIYYAAVAREFAVERARRGVDSIALLERSADGHAFLSAYPRAAHLATRWGESLVRDGRTAEARRVLRTALARWRCEPAAAARAFGWWSASWGVALTPRGLRNRAVTAASDAMPPRALTSPGERW